MDFRDRGRTLGWASDEQSGQKIGVLAAIPALGLDGLSSSAYGPEAALAILLPLGAVGLNYILPITGIILAQLGGAFGTEGEYLAPPW